MLGYGQIVLDGLMLRLLKHMERLFSQQLYLKQETERRLPIQKTKITLAQLMQILMFIMNILLIHIPILLLKN